MNPGTPVCTTELNLTFVVMASLISCMAAPIECGLDAIRPMVGVPELGGDEQVLSYHRSRGQGFVERGTHRFLIAIAFGAIEVSESHL
jgi:hypothetical protein